LRLEKAGPSCGTRPSEPCGCGTTLKRYTCCRNASGRQYREASVRLDVYVPLMLEPGVVSMNIKAVL
jgi:hypothetical protein